MVVVVWVVVVVYLKCKMDGYVFEDLDVDLCIWMMDEFVVIMEKKGF